MKDVRQTVVYLKGFSLIEVLIAITIFSIGMLALAYLQGSLTRSASDANVRTVATSVAEETIEYQRGFGLITTDPAGLIYAYDDIVSDTSSIYRGSIQYDLTQTVTPYYYIRGTGLFSETNSESAAFPDFKLLTVNVQWGANAGFVIDESTEVSAADLNSGEITITDVIHSSTSQANSQVRSEDEDLEFEPYVNYSPGLNPDIVAISLGDNKFKEALTPVPRVIRADELVESRFDVVTYSQTGEGSLFLRREELISVTCQCTLKAAPADADSGGRRPTTWLGDEYLEPQFIAKPYGVPIAGIQSQYCDACCQDHHDGGTGTEDPSGDPGAIQAYPFRPDADYWGSGTTFEGDHKHYQRDRRGVLTLAELVDDVYVESCKLVRKDGFFRVAQDFRLENRNVFPRDFLDQSAEIDKYSDFITGSVTTFVNAMTDGYENSPPSIPPPSRTPNGVSPAPVTDLTYAYTHLPTALGADFQQLRTRAVYVDYLNEDLRAVITCLQANGTAETCRSGDVILDQTESENILELIPFFDVQLTFLDRWSESPPSDPVETTNEAVKTNNTHSRGMANRSGGAGDAQVHSRGHAGNAGFTDTDPIDPNESLNVTISEIQVIVNTDNPPDPQGTLVTIIFKSGVPGLQTTNIEIVATNALCNRTPDGFICLVPNGSSLSAVEMTGHEKANTVVKACSATLPISNTSNGNLPVALVDISIASGDVVHIVSLEADTCGA